MKIAHIIQFFIMLCIVLHDSSIICSEHINTREEEMLLEAAQDGDFALTQSLMQRRINPNIFSKSGMTPLHIATSKKDKRMVELLLNNGADASIQNYFNGTTPLHIATASNNKTLTSLLLAKGANPKIEDEAEISPLGIAVSSGDTEMIEMLKCAAEEQERKLKEQEQRLRLLQEQALKRQEQALKRQEQELELIEKVKNLAIKAQDISSAQLTLHQTIKTGSIEAVKALLSQKNIDINARDETGNAPLHWAVLYQRPDVVDMLLANGARVDIRNRKGQIPLHLAALKKDQNIVRMLLAQDTTQEARKAQLNAQDAIGDTPLHQAVHVNDLDMIKLLIDQGALKNIENKLGFTPPALVNQRKVRMRHKQKLEHEREAKIDEKTIALRRQQAKLNKKVMKELLQKNTTQQAKGSRKKMASMHLGSSALSN